VRHLLPALMLVTALSACSSDEPSAPGRDDDAEGSTADPSGAAAEPTGAPAPAFCARISATDLSEWLGAEVSIADSPAARDDPDAVQCEAIGEPSTYVFVEWRLDDVAPTQTEDVPDQLTTVSAEGDAEDGRTTTATATRFHPDSEVTDEAMQTAVDNVVAAYAVPGSPAAPDDPCSLVSDADVTSWAGFPVEVGDTTESGRDDLLCRTVVGDEDGDDALANIEWRLTPPHQTLAYEVSGPGQEPEPVTLPGGEPAVVSYDDGFRLAKVAAQAGEQTVVVEVRGSVFSDDDEYPAARLRELAQSVANAYAR
jgi:hypothetical protein